MAKQSKGSKQQKVYNLSSLDGVRDVAVGHKAAAERHSKNYSKSDYTPAHDVNASFHDSAARAKRWGLG